MHDNVLLSVRGQAVNEQGKFLKTVCKFGVRISDENNLRFFRDEISSFRGNTSSIADRFRLFSAFCHDSYQDIGLLPIHISNAFYHYAESINDKAEKRYFSSDEEVAKLKRIIREEVYSQFKDVYRLVDDKVVRDLFILSESFPGFTKEKPQAVVVYREIEKRVSSGLRMNRLVVARNNESLASILGVSKKHAEAIPSWQKAHEFFYNEIFPAMYKRFEKIQKMFNTLQEAAKNEGPLPIECEDIQEDMKRNGVNPDKFSQPLKKSDKPVYVNGASRYRFDFHDKIVVKEPDVFMAKDVKPCLAMEYFTALQENTFVSYCMNRILNGDIDDELQKEIGSPFNVDLAAVTIQKWQEQLETSSEPVM